MRAPLFLPPFGAVASLLCLSFALGCGGSQKSFDGAVYRNGPVAFRVPAPPSGWRRVELESASLAFRDDAHDAVVLVNGRCGGKDDDTPLAALTGHLIMGTTEREFVKEETLPFDGREARHSLLRAKLDGVPRVYDIFVTKKDGCVYDFVHVAPSEGAGTPDFERFVSGFQTLGTGAL